jgi:hypothetical protein
MADIREQLVKMVIKEQMNDVIGGFENSLMDGHIKEMPEHKILVEAIYTQTMQANMVSTAMGRMVVKKHIRFIGSERIRAFIEKQVAKAGY